MSGKQTGLYASKKCRHTAKDAEALVRYPARIRKPAPCGNPLSDALMCYPARTGLYAGGRLRMTSASSASDRLLPYVSNGNRNMQPVLYSEQP